MSQFCFEKVVLIIFLLISILGLSYLWYRVLCVNHDSYEERNVVDYAKGAELWDGSYA